MMLFSRKISSHDIYTQRPGSEYVRNVCSFTCGRFWHLIYLSLSFVIFPFSIVDFPCDTCRFSWRDKQDEKDRCFCDKKRMHTCIFSFSRFFTPPFFLEKREMRNAL